MYWTVIPSDGTYDILPPKTRGEGANTYITAQTTDDDAGTVVIDGPGAGTVTLGYFVDTSSTATFNAFSAGTLTDRDVSVHHGKGLRLAVTVTGTDASLLRIGYAGEAS